MMCVDSNIFEVAEPFAKKLPVNKIADKMIIAQLQYTTAFLAELLAVSARQAATTNGNSISNDTKMPEKSIRKYTPFS